MGTVTVTIQHSFPAWRKKIMLPIETLLRAVHGARDRSTSSSTTSHKRDEKFVKDLSYQ